jgi:hypothetical protein
MWSGDFEHPAVSLRGEAMDATGWNVKGGAFLEREGGETGLVLADLEHAIARLQKEGLFFYAMVLEAETFARSDEENFRDVAGSVSPNELVTPRLVNFLNYVFRFYGQDSS